MEIFLSFVSILIILILIVFACVVFTNAVEHLGEELNLSEGAVGSVLAAVGTALPETIVPLVAIIGGYLAGADMTKANEIGIGAILGAPFMLGTLAFFVTGLAVFVFTKSGRRTKEMPVNTIIMFRDLHYFVLAYTIAILSSFIPYRPLKFVMAGFLLLIYLIYVIKTIQTASKETEGGQEELAALYLTRYIEPPKNLHLPFILLQLMLSLVGIILLSHVFVGQIEFLSEFFKINPLILSLIITPIATELPEKFNSVIWIRAKKDTLAMGNITGAMVFQSCIPTAIGLTLTPWILNTDALINVVVVYLSVGVVYLNIVRNKGILQPSALLTGGLFYLIYLIYVIFRVTNHS
jgi:cation:H+ antiporter